MKFSTQKYQMFNSPQTSSESFMEFLRKIEEKWQKTWEETRIFESDPDQKKRKFFVTFPFPYINGPNHVGHTFTASRTDAYSRFKRMQGYNVLFPWAWHWTGQPLKGASQRIAEGDKDFIKVLREVDGVPEEELEKFIDPINMARYYTRESRIAAKLSGFSVDWRREFNTAMPAFQKFIEWQYENLRTRGYVIKGTHPVVWCPKDKSPTGDHDRQEGEGVRPEKYTLMKFKLDKESYLPAATFRPETIFGVTNLWIHPDEIYVEAKVDDEKWVISERASEKLKEQLRTVEVERKFKGMELVGKTSENPITRERLLILPGWFVDPTNATGVVYSVPAHAPYDWLALEDLKKKTEILREFGVDPEAVKNIKPISMIKTESFSEFPAAEMVERLDVRDQHDPKAEEATKILYKKEFHNGILKRNCMQYAGKKVREVKELLINDLEEHGIADSMYDLTQHVVCRCLTPCIVKVLQDQWFLKYSDPVWKKRVKQALTRMEIYPETARQWFIAVIDWLGEWACARRTGLGTPLPWAEGWIIETLSDSTIYMAFYTVKHHIIQHKIEPEMLTKEVFSFIFLGEGSLGQVASRSGIRAEILKEMRKEFLYWYPVDLRVSAKELVPNHLTFFLFQHVALFPPNNWPKAVGVNGMLLNEGKQMHKSKGNFIPAKKAIEEYGADATRCTLMLSAEGMDDPDWRKEHVGDMETKIESFYNFAKKIIRDTKSQEDGHLERWLTSRLQHRITEVTENLEEMRTRTALEIALFEVWNDFRWYKNRKGIIDTEAAKEGLRIWLRLLSPFAPHICEELWSEIGEEGFISLARWPEVDEERMYIEEEKKETLLEEVIEDTLSILKATKITPQKIYYYTASPWKWKVYLEILEKGKYGEVIIREIMKKIAQEEEMKGKLQKAADFALKIIQQTRNMPETRKSSLLETGVLNEKEVIREAKDFLAERFKAEIIVYSEDETGIYDPKKKARSSIPHRPAIYME
jgi:leucyl-tRNA synthetase